MGEPQVKVYAGYLDLVRNVDLNWTYHGPGWWPSQAGEADKPRTHTLVATTTVAIGDDLEPRVYTFFLHVHTAHAVNLETGRLPMALGAFFEPGRSASLSGQQFKSNAFANDRVLNAVRAKFTEKFVSATQVLASQVKTDKAPVPEKKQVPAAKVKPKEEDSDWGSGYGGYVGGGGGDGWPSGEAGSGSGSSSSSDSSKSSSKVASKVQQSEEEVPDSWDQD